MDAALAAFSRLVRAPERGLDLAGGALAIAQIEHPDLVPERHLWRFDDLAARSGVTGRVGAREALRRLRRFLFEEEGFRGNAGEYYDPRNSCLNDVLDRKLGIPITLSVVTLEVGRRLGLSLTGIGLPGHFVVAAEVDGERVLLDPFQGGAVLTRETAAAVVARVFGRTVELTEDHFAPVTKREILVRMLRNLKSIYSGREEWTKALAVVDRLLVLEAESPVHHRDRGTVLVKLGRLWDGAAEWHRYLTSYPHAGDAERLRLELQRVRHTLASLN